jgi:hypothetical protein
VLAQLAPYVGSFKLSVRDSKPRPNDKLIESILTDLKAMPADREVFEWMPISNEGVYNAVIKNIRFPPKLERKAAIFWQVTVDSMIDFLTPIIGHSEVLSSQQILETMDLTKSCGFPYSHKYPTKEAFYSQCLPWCEEQIQLMSESEYVALVAPVGKRSLMPAKKVASNMPRSILPVDPIHTLALKRVSHDFNERFQRYPYRTMSALGAPILNGGARVRWQYLGIHSKGFGADIDQQEARFFPYAMNAILAIRLNFLRADPTWKLVLRNLYNAIQHAYVIMPDGHTFEKWFGNLTGQSNTAHDNTMFCIMLFIFAWFWIMRTGMSDFLRSVRLLTLGDDSAWSAETTVLDKYNFVSIATVLHEQLWVSISSPSHVPQPVTEILFLSSTVGIDILGRPYIKLIWDRVISSFIQGGKNYPAIPAEIPPWYLQRFANILIAVGGDDWQRGIVRAVIERWVDIHEPAYHGSLSWEQAKRSVLSDATIRKVHHAYQALRVQRASTLDKQQTMDSHVTEAMLLGSGIILAPFVGYDTYKHHFHSSPIDDAVGLLQRLDTPGNDFFAKSWQSRFVNNDGAKHPGPPKGARRIGLKQW